MNVQMETPKTYNIQGRTTPVYLVLEKDPLISSDLAEILERTGPCRIFQLADVEEARSLLAKVSQVDAAYLEVDLETLETSGLARELILRGARIILTAGEGDADRIRSKNWGVLLRPFTEPMVREALAATPKPPKRRAI